MSDKDKNPIEALNALPGSLPQMGETSDIDHIERPLWEVDERFLNPFAPVPPVQTWVTMGERPAIPRSGIITFSAKPKQGKSLSLYALLIPILTGEDFDTLRHVADRPRLVIVFDTEMDTATLSKRVMSMQYALGDVAPRFQTVPLLEVPKSKRREIIEDITGQYNPDIVVIDQIARLVANFNDAAEATEFGEWLAQFAAKRTVMVVIHQNKATDNTQMKGHLGSLLEELAVENYSVSRKNGIFRITPTNARQSCVDTESAPVTFALNEAGEIISATKVIEETRAAQAEDWRNDFRLIFKDDKELKYSEILKRIQNEQSLAKTAAETKIRNATKAGVLEKTKPSDARSPYRLIESPISDFDELECVNP